MPEERGISMNEFKTVVESFRSEIRKVAEVTNHLFNKFEKVENKLEKVEDKLEKVEDKLEKVEDKLEKMDKDLQVVKLDVSGLKEQVGFLMEGQTEIKSELRAGLKDRVTYQDFDKLEKRVVRLEKKVA
jgi:chromosome segregation ATPase